MPRPCDLDLLTLKVVSKSRVTWATSANLHFLGLSVLDLGPMYMTDVRQHHLLMPPPRGRRHNNWQFHMTAEITHNMFSHVVFNYLSQKV